MLRRVKNEEWSDVVREMEADAWGSTKDTGQDYKAWEVGREVQYSEG